MKTSTLHLSFQVSAPDLPSFLTHWCSKYSYATEHKYTNNIGNPLTENSLQELFEWKNGTGSVIAVPKLRSIRENYPVTFNGDRRERYLNHKQPGGAIWNIFFLHCLEPHAWPIFDQHTFRAMHYMETGKIVEIGGTDKQKYQSYESRYIPFVKRLQCPDQRTIDRALFTFGKFLKVGARYI